MELKRIRSVLFIWQKLFQYISYGLLFTIYILVFPTNARDKAYIERFDFPDWYNTIIYFVMVFLIIMALYLTFAKWHKKGNIEISEKLVRISGIEYNVPHLTDITVLKNPEKYKPKNRTIFNGGANNWLKFKYRGKN